MAIKKIFAFFCLLSLNAKEHSSFIRVVPTPHEIVLRAVIMRSLFYLDPKMKETHLSEIKDNVGKCEINKNSRWGQLLLNNSVSYADVEATELLLKHGALVNARNETNGSTPLMSAVNALINHKEKVMAKSVCDLNFETRLYSIVDKLLFAGADANLAAHNGLTPIFVAHKNSLERLVSIFQEQNLPECSICLEPTGKRRKILACGHNFHPECVNTWLAEKGNCPVCREIY